MKKESAAASLPPGIENFDKLPDIARVRLPVVKMLYACSAPTVWRGVKDGRIPKPRKFGRITDWGVGDLRKSLAIAS